MVPRPGLALKRAEVLGTFRWEKTSPRTDQRGRNEDGSKTAMRVLGW
jgi:hypothetical protein